MNAWRERMCDLAASVWTSRKASPDEIRDEIRAAVGAGIPLEQEDALQTLNDQEIRTVLVSLQIPAEQLDKHGQFDTELCPECFAMPGECEPSCGQYEEPEDDRELHEIPRTEDAMVSLLDEVIHGYLDDNFSGGWSTKTFAEAQLLTDNKGLVVRIADVEYQIQVVKSK